MGRIFQRTRAGECCYLCFYLCWVLLSLQDRFETEVEAYQRSSYLQGSVLPRFYGSVQVEPSSGDHDFPKVALYGIILEDVGAVDLSKYDLSVGDYTALGYSLVAAVSTFLAHGVVHGDIRSHNIILSSDDRTVLIDFGNSTLRTAEATDKEWEEEIDFKGNISVLQYLLHNRQIRPLSPLDTRTNVALSFHHFNNVGLRDKPANWLKQYYDDVPRTTMAHRRIDHLVDENRPQAFVGRVCNRAL